MSQPFALRPYQRAAIDAVTAAELRGVRRPLVAHPTGAGKTITFAQLIAERPEARTLILVHRDELVAQTLAKLALVAPGLRTGVVKAARNDVAAPVVVGSVQTLERVSRLDPCLPRDLLIVDEAHHCTMSNMWFRILARAGCYPEVHQTPVQPVAIGYTATPYRPSNESIVGPGQPFEETVHAYALAEAITCGHLCTLRSKQISVDVDLDAVPRDGRDFSEVALDLAFLAAKVPEHIVQAWLLHAAERRTVVFCPGVEMAYATLQTFRQQGIAAALVLGATPAAEREAAYLGLRTGQIQVLLSVSVLTEGWDEPSVDCAVIARPTTSKVLFTQMIGRTLRNFPGKDSALILDLVGATTRHHLMSVASLYGLAAVEPKKDHAKLRDSDEELVGPARLPGEEPFQPLLPMGTLKAVEVNLYRKSPMRWIQTRQGAYVLAVKGGTIRLKCEDPVKDLWIVEWTTPGSRTAPIRLAQAVPLTYAQGIAEDSAREMPGGVSLVKRDARWLVRAASEKQQAFARKLGIDPRRFPTAGQLSEAISAVVGDW